MIQSNQYYKQVKLLLEVLPIVMENEMFALKGGTAINLFYQNMPRLSVDIDLVYLYNEEREITLTKIRNALSDIENRMNERIINLSTSILKNYKLIIRSDKTFIKIEPNCILRGTVFPCESKEICENAKREFNKSFQVRVASKPDVFGGKICAALNRQHPRDLFDIKYFLNTNEINEDIKNAFLFYLISHPRPINEVLNPRYLDQKLIYQNEFIDMTSEAFTYENFENTRENLVKLIRNALTDNDKEFLLSLKRGDPNWNLTSISHVKDYPSVRWKLLNINKMTDKKRKNDYKKLESILTI